MTPNADMIALKKRLSRFCRETIESRIATARQAMDSAQEAANAEEKSSAGDKYETARAMGQLNKEMFARQLAGHLKELSEFNSLNTDAVHQIVTPGALLQCSGALFFFLSAGLGKQTVDGQPILFLSPHAPLAKTIINKKPGDQLTFNGRVMTIESIC
ncbi:hypothetical protein [Flavihumibacter petaseus]|uniref:Transcription elongation factor GreA/GreB C-terminal domain-containing protein n=1 Tax=Flavihumibacter petaseus NBRC 106054 TaxID=1220578 RepID=A0A0E9MZZ0_9BACT|nr:hypothetical protein [Flavihumibacter petaseus]GAO43103.1 hypothetical protein FPE01S_02_02070 [Flavihumibacter petaseus NBRC 106054]